MIDVLKRLAELDAKNPNIVKESNLPIEECGMMPEMGMMSPPPSKPDFPATINMSAASGEELSDMLTTIMTLAGQKSSDEIPPMGATMVPPAAGVLEPASDGMGPPEMKTGTDSMRSVIDKLNSVDDEEPEDQEGSEDDEDKEKVDEYDNEPDPQSSGYGSMTPTGNDMHSKGAEAPKVNGGGNPMQKTMEQIEKDLFMDYRKFISEQ